MDINKVIYLEKYYNKIINFRKLDKFKNLSNNVFSEEMKKLFPNFYNQNKKLFTLIVENKDLNILDNMFNILKKINCEFKSRENEISIIEPKINDIKAFLEVNKKISKHKLLKFVKQTSGSFADKYPIIIDNLFEENTRNLPIDDLLFNQVKYKYEINLGKILYDKYISK